jgi:hypothetical protein
MEKKYIIKAKEKVNSHEGFMGDGLYCMVNLLIISVGSACLCQEVVSFLFLRLLGLESLKDLIYFFFVSFSLV